MPPRAILHLCVCLSILLSACTQKHFQVVNTGHEGQPIPIVNLISPDSNRHINTQDIPAGSPIVMFYFRPDCPFCHQEIEEIAKHISSMHGAQFFLLTAHPSDTLQSFYRKIQRQHLPNLFVGIDYKNNFHNYFSPEGVPYTAVYHRNKTLSQVYLGALTGKDLANAVNN